MLADFLQNRCMETSFENFRDVLLGHKHFRRMLDTPLIQTEERVERAHFEKMCDKQRAPYAPVEGTLVLTKKGSKTAKQK
jgi:hypothetical protein